MNSAEQKSGIRIFLPLILPTCIMNIWNNPAACRQQNRTSRILSGKPFLKMMKCSVKKHAIRDCTRDNIRMPEGIRARCHLVPTVVPGKFRKYLPAAASLVYFQGKGRNNVTAGIAASNGNTDKSSSSQTMRCFFISSFITVQEDTSS